MNTVIITLIIFTAAILVAIAMVYTLYLVGKAEKEKDFIYLAGPITGYNLEERKQLFNETKTFLRSLKQNESLKILTPFDIVPDPIAADPEAWGQAMLICLKYVNKKSCKAVYLLPGWENSRGATIEKIFNEALNKDTFKLIVFDGIIICYQLK